MSDHPLRLVHLIRLSRRTWAVLWQTIALALGMQGVFLGSPMACGSCEAHDQHA